VAPVTLAALAALLAGTASGCSTSAGRNGKPVVVATTTQLGDFARAVGGSAVRVHQILEPNSDPHQYEPRPDDIVAAGDATVVLESGDGLDSWMRDVLKNAGGHARVAVLADAAVSHLAGQSSGPEASRYDPHWWHDPHNAEAAVRAIRDALAAAVPARRAIFQRNAATYLRKLQALDAGIRACIDAIPPARRTLVTSHDAFGYFAQRYRVRVVGAIVPSQTTEAQASAGDVAQLARQVRREHVRAIFLESSVNSKLGKAVARQTGAIGNLTLYGDTLGPPGSPGATYIGMEVANAAAMVRGFTGGRRGCHIRVQR
jgi:ABC-type Zn uptake system ZnuABC Zn-binding protein ZnuA